MRESFSIKPETLRGAAGSWRREGQTLEEELNRLRSRLEGLGEPWGNDDPGRSFAASYVPNANTLFESIAAISAGLGKLADGLVLMASNYDGSDQASHIPRA